MYVLPAGFVLFPFSIWLLWQASRTARFKLNHIILDKESRRLQRKSELVGEKNNMELAKFFSSSRKKIYKAGLYILGSFLVMFCAFYFTLKTPGSIKESPAWLIALSVGAYFLCVLVFQFIIPLLDLKQLESDRKELLDLDN